MPKLQSNHSVRYDSLMITIEKYFEKKDSLERVHTWQISREHRKILDSILRQLYEHPNTKFSSRLTKRRGSNR